MSLALLVSLDMLHCCNFLFLRNRRINITLQERENQTKMLTFSPSTLVPSAGRLGELCWAGGAQKPPCPLTIALSLCQLLDYLCLQAPGSRARLLLSFGGGNSRSAWLCSRPGGFESIFHFFSRWGRSAGAFHICLPFAQEEPAAGSVEGKSLTQNRAVLLGRGAPQFCLSKDVALY